jgi:uncharacterized protein YjdB
LRATCTGSAATARRVIRQAHAHCARGFALAAILTVVASCGGGEVSTKPMESALTGVRLAPTELSLHVTETGRLAATLLGPGASTGRGTIAYTSSEPTIATVNGSGLITALAPGSATITAAGSHPSTSTLTASSVSATALVTVTALPNALTDLVVTPSAPTVPVGLTVSLIAIPTTYSATVTSSCTYESAGNATATVSAAGEVTGVAIGTVLITVSCSGSGPGVTANTLVRTVSVSVTPAPVATVAVTTPFAYLQPGPGSGRTTTVLSVDLRDAAGNLLTGRTITWASSNPDVATVNGSGTVSALDTGSVVVSAASEGVSGSVTINVVRAFGVVHADRPTIASYSSGVNSAGRANTVTRTGVGRYTVTFPDLGTATIGRSFVFLASAVSGAANTALAAPGAVCIVTEGSTATPVTLTVRCEHPVTGADSDAEFRAVVIGESALGGAHAFTRHNAGAVAPYQPPPSFSFNSLGAAMTIVPNAQPGEYDNLLVRHAQGLPFVAQAAIVEVVPSGTGESCSLTYIGLNESAVSTFCRTRAGTVIDRTHVVLRPTAGRPGRGAALAFVLPDGTNTNQGFQSGGNTVSTRTGPGKFTLTFSGVTAPATPFFVAVNPWAHDGIRCTHHVVSAAPLSVDIACFDATGAFSNVFGAVNVLVLQ